MANEILYIGEDRMEQKIVLKTAVSLLVLIALIILLSSISMKLWERNLKKSSCVGKWFLKKE